MNLKDWLALNKRSGRSFALLIGLHENTIYNILKGKKTTFETAEIIYKATEKCVAWQDLVQTEIARKKPRKSSPGLGQAS